MNRNQYMGIVGMATGVAFFVTLYFLMRVLNQVIALSLASTWILPFAVAGLVLLYYKRRTALDERDRLIQRKAAGLSLATVWVVYKKRPENPEPLARG